MKKIDSSTKVYYRTMLGEVIYGVEFSIGESYARLEHFKYLDNFDLSVDKRYKMCRLDEINSYVTVIQRTIEKVLGIGFITVEVVERSMYTVTEVDGLPVLTFSN